MLPTADPHVFIEARGKGWVRYQNDEGRRWEVYGECVLVGNCIVGSVIEVEGEPIEVHDHAHWRTLQEQLGEHLGFEHDSPITPEFHGCCPFTFRELESV